MDISVFLQIAILLIFGLGCLLLMRFWQSACTNPTLRTILNRRSVRKYNDKPVSRKQLETILRAGMAAPSAGDQRPFSFVAVAEHETLVKLAAALPYARMLNQAAAAIVVCGQPAKAISQTENTFWVQDCSVASGNILLAAESMGIGAVWVGVHPNAEREAAVRKILSVPDTLVPLNVVSLGYPKEKQKPGDKFDPKSIHWERY
jgi:nitroreductase